MLIFGVGTPNHINPALIIELEYGFTNNLTPEESLIPPIAVGLKLTIISKLRYCNEFEG